MNKVIRVISALGAGASLVWGITRSLRRKKGDTDDGGPDWPPRDAEKAAKAEPKKAAAKAEPKKAAAKEEPKKAVAKEEPKKAAAKEEPKKAAAKEEPKKAAAKEEPKKAAAKEEPKAAEVDDGPPVVKGVELEHPAAVVALVNGIDEEGLKDLGIKGKAAQKVLDTRPIETVHDLAVPGIGRRTLQSLAGATE